MELSIQVQGLCILDEYLEDFPEVKLLLRVDSGFATLSFINSVKKTIQAM